MSNVRDILKNAIMAIRSGDAKVVRDSVKEAILAKVRGRLVEKEKEVSRTFFSNIPTKKE